MNKKNCIFHDWLRRFVVIDEFHNFFVWLLEEIRNFFMRLIDKIRNFFMQPRENLRYFPRSFEEICDFLSGIVRENSQFFFLYYLMKFTIFFLRSFDEIGDDNLTKFLIFLFIFSPLWSVDGIYGFSCNRLTKLVTLSTIV